MTRLKRKAVYKRVKKNPVKEGGNIISDYEIIIPSLSKEIRLRKIISRDPKTKKRIVLLTNNLKWSAGTVAGVYKERWQIELFFKAIKQNLKIKRFYGNTKNAVMTQIWIALIAYLLFLSTEGEIKKCTFVIYLFYFFNKDNVVSAGFTL